MNWDIEEIADLVPDVLEARARLGFDPVRWETLPTRLMCVIRELDELEHALGIGDFDGIVLESADVAMYLVQTIADLWPTRWGKRHAHGARGTAYAAPETLTKPTRQHIANAFEAWRQLDEQNASICIELALLEIMRLAKALDVPLPGAMVAKIDMLRSRELRNGGKHPAS